MSRLNLTFLGNCPVCSTAYEQKKTSVVKKDEEVVTLHIDCGRCQSSILLTIHSGLKGLVTTVGMPTDLKKSDLTRLKHSRQINSDDVLELHTFLEKENEREFKSKKKN